MACIVNLRTDLNPSAEAGGVWTYEGYSTTPISDISQSGGVAPCGDSYNVGDTLLGDDPAFDLSGCIPPYPTVRNKNDGYWHFNYTAGICSVRIIIRNVASPCAGEDVNETICTDSLGSDINIRDKFNENSLCGNITARGDSNTFVESVITDDDGSPFYILSQGPQQQEMIHSSSLTPGTYHYTNTVTIKDLATYPNTGACEDCSNDVAIYTLKVVQPTYPGDFNRTPEAILCPAASCGVQMQTLISGSTDFGGYWVYMGEYTLGIGGVVANSANLNINGGGFQIYGADSFLANNLSMTLEVDPADIGKSFRFKYVVNGGTACEAYEEVNIKIVPVPNPGIPNPDFNGCLADFAATYGTGGTTVFTPFSYLTGNPTDDGNWTVDILSSSDPITAGQFLATWTNAGNDIGMDDTLDFGVLSSSAWVEVRFTYTVPATISNVICAECLEHTSSFVIKLAGGCSSGTTQYTQNNPYQLSSVNNGGNGFVIFNAHTLLDNADDCGTWYVDATSPAIQGLCSGSQGTHPTCEETKNPGAQLSIYSNGSLYLDFSTVPSGTYILRYKTGSLVFTTSGIIDCLDDTKVWIHVDCNGGFCPDNKVKSLDIRISHYYGEGPNDNDAFFITELLLPTGNPFTLPKAFATWDWNPSIVASDGHLYVYKQYVDGLNALNLPNIKFDYLPDTFDPNVPSGDSSRQHRYMRVTFPDCPTFKPFTIAFGTIHYTDSKIKDGHFYTSLEDDNLNVAATVGHSVAPFGYTPLLAETSSYDCE